MYLTIPELRTAQGHPFSLIGPNRVQIKEILLHCINVYTVHVYISGVHNVSYLHIYIAIILRTSVLRADTSDLRIRVMVSSNTRGAAIIRGCVMIDRSICRIIQWKPIYTIREEKTCTKLKC